MKIINSFLLVFFTAVFVACSSEEYISSYRINEVFPGMRLDSISNGHAMNFKLKYIGDKLMEYGEYLENGEVHKSRLYKLDWRKDRIDIYNGVREELICSAIVGDNQFVKECYDSEGELLHVFTYDTDGHLIRYNEDPMSYGTPDYKVLQWDNGNLVAFESHYFRSNGNSEDGEKTTEFSGFKHENAGRIAHLDSSIYGEYLGSLMYISALYYAGMLGLGMENYPSSYYLSSQKGGWGSLNVTTKDGYVIKDDRRDYFYINTKEQ